MFYSWCAVYFHCCRQRWSISLCQQLTGIAVNVHCTQNATLYTMSSKDLWIPRRKTKTHAAANAPVSQIVLILEHAAL